MPGDPVLERLEDQINWYDHKSNTNQRSYKFLKIVVVVVAALIPLISSSKLPFAPEGLPGWVAGALGAIIAVAEGLQQLNQYQTNWILYRSTCETLKHEKFLFLGQAGPYLDAAKSHSVLAERIEGLVSQEHAKWTSSREGDNKTRGSNSQ